MKTLLLSISAAFAVGATGVAWYASRDTSDTLKALAQVQTEIGRSKAAAERAATRLAKLDESASTERGKLKALQRGAPPSPTGSSAAALSPAQESTGKQDTPESMAAKVAASLAKAKNAAAELLDFATERLWFANTYQALFTALRLSPEQCEKFVEIGMRRYERMKDLSALRGTDQILPDTDAAVRQFTEDTKAEETAAYRDLLGPEGYQRFVDYNRTAYSRDIVSSLAAAAVLAGIPFTGEQLDQFVRITSENYLQKPWEGHVHFYWNGAPIDWEKADAQVRPLMSDAQWQLYLNHAPGDTRQQSRMKDIFDQLLTKARAGEKALAGTQPKN